MKSIENLNFSYGDAKVLSDFSVSLPDKGSVAIAGASGAGKTTLLRIIAGLEKNYSGTLQGFENSTFSISFQAPRLLPWLSARENIACVLNGSHRNRLAEADSWLEKLDMADFSDKRPDKLSGGQQQRVSLARAFAKDSDILLLDEPTTGLDEKLRDNVLKIIAGEAEKRLVIYVTHGETEKNAANAVIYL
ncbi:MAG: ATP-binding cassette domain-containing protein [Clostridia bacterium]|nr:ATP-binding cassette domain-containing protein [Clostridia bacterium]